MFIFVSKAMTLRGLIFDLHRKIAWLDQNKAIGSTYFATGLLFCFSMKEGIRNQRGKFFFHHGKPFYSSSPFGKEIFKSHAFLERIFKKHSAHKNSVHPTESACVLQAFAKTGSSTFSPSAFSRSFDTSRLG